jgi:hypothetical protein
MRLKYHAARLFLVVVRINLWVRSQYIPRFEEKVERSTGIPVDTLVEVTETVIVRMEN